MEETTQWGWRDYALALTLAATFTISIYLIYCYWDDMGNAIFRSSNNVIGVGRIVSTITNLLQISLIRRLEIIPTRRISMQFLTQAIEILREAPYRLEE